jgi:AbrB family looped-hinge helix DNA binding protein
MALATMTTKGQVTIPKDIRKQLHLNSGDKIEIVISTKGEAIMRPLSAKVDDIFGILQTNRKAVSVEDMNSVLKEKFKSKYS